MDYKKYEGEANVILWFPYGLSLKESSLWSPAGPFTVLLRWVKTSKVGSSFNLSYTPNAGSFVIIIIKNKPKKKLSKINSVYMPDDFLGSSSQLLDFLEEVPL